MGDDSDEDVDIPVARDTRSETVDSLDLLMAEGNDPPVASTDTQPSPCGEVDGAAKSALLAAIGDGSDSDAEPDTPVNVMQPAKASGTDAKNILLAAMGDASDSDAEPDTPVNVVQPAKASGTNAKNILLAAMGNDSDSDAEPDTPVSVVQPAKASRTDAKNILLAAMGDSSDSDSDAEPRTSGEQAKSALLAAMAMGDSDSDESL